MTGTAILTDCPSSWLWIISSSCTNAWLPFAFELHRTKSVCCLSYETISANPR
jgi:hypothetical protein